MNKLNVTLTKGTQSIELNGNPLRGVRSIELRAAAGNLVTAKIELFAQVEGEFEIPDEELVIVEQTELGDDFKSYTAVNNSGLGTVPQ